MTSTAPATADEPTTDASTDAGEEFVYLDPGSIIIGSNVRTDLPDAKEFRRSIKERGVLEAVTVYRNDEGQHVCLRGQRRTVEAASVGTPTGLIRRAWSRSPRRPTGSLTRWSRTSTVRGCARPRSSRASRS